MRDSDQFYREVLPPEIAEMSLSPRTREKVIAELCTAAYVNPDAAFLQVLAWSEADTAVAAVAKILVSPPRQLSMREYCIAVTFIKASLPARLEDDPDCLKKGELEALVQLAKRLRNNNPEEGKSDQERADRRMIKIQADYLLEALAPFGFTPI